MTRIRLADRIANVMLDPDSGYGNVIMWGDGLLNDVAYGHVTGRMSKHPLDRMIMALNALERAPDLFQKSWTLAHDSNGRQRRVRSFRLIGTPRQCPDDKHYFTGNPLRCRDCSKPCKPTKDEHYP